MPNKVAKGLVAVLIIAAIGIGNAAYEGGNITGAALGLSASACGDIRLWAAAIGLTAFMLLVSGHYKWLEKTLLALVMLMSTVFLSLMVYVGINSDLLLSGVLLKTSVLSNSALALAIIGITIVPYNLFLHAGMSAQNAQNKSASPANNSALLASLGIKPLSLIMLAQTANAMLLAYISFAFGLGMQ